MLFTPRHGPHIFMKFKLVETMPSLASPDRNFNHFDSISMLDDR